MSRVLWVAWMDTGGISYSGEEFMAVSESEDGVLEAMAGAFDDYLASGPGHGDDNRERWLTGHAEGGDEWLFGDDRRYSAEFGEDLLAFGRELSDYYGITRERVELGKGARV